MLPPSTNAGYEGAPLAAHFLTLLGVLTLVPGLIHSFLPDGGAGVIAGIDLSRQGATIASVFAWAGATQIVWGTTLVLASLRYRALVPLLLALVGIEQALIALNLWWLKPSPTGDSPPAAWGTLVALPLILAALALALRGRRGAPLAAPSR